jgi:hypothetical protein
MHKNRLKCRECGARNSKVGVSELTKKPVAVCLNCRANITLYTDSDGKVRPATIPPKERKQNPLRGY